MIYRLILSIIINNHISFTLFIFNIAQLMLILFIYIYIYVMFYLYVIVNIILHYYPCSDPNVSLTYLCQLSINDCY